MEFVPNNESFTSMTTRNFVWGLIGIVFGLVINNLSKHFVDFFKIESKNIKILIQLLFCSIALSYVHTHINNEFGWTWQNVTPGLFFVSFFFGVQYLAFTTIQDVYVN